MSLDLTLSDDLRQILDAAQSMLDTHYPVNRLRDGGHTDALAPLAEFGTFLLSQPEAEGGAGFSVVEEALLHAAFGRHLLSPSVIAMAVATRVARETGRDDLAERIGSGEALVCAGIAATKGTLLVEPNGAAHALVRDAGGLTLCALDGAPRENVTSMGHGRPMARMTTPVSSANDARAGEDTVRTHDLLCAAQLLGVAAGARDLAVDYAQIREQFGRPIGSFQAIKHHCANMTIGVEMVSAQLDMAAIALRDGAEDAAFQVAALARLARRVALDNARLGIQIHGGIGFSAEADAQLYLKQAHLLGNYTTAQTFLSLPSPMAATGEAP